MTLLLRLCPGLCNAHQMCPFAKSHLLPPTCSRNIKKSTARFFQPLLWGLISHNAKPCWPTEVWSGICHSEELVGAHVEQQVPGSAKESSLVG